MTFFINPGLENIKPGFHVYVELSLSCARLMAGRVTTLWVKHLLSVN